jgi:hypothetical protein
VWACRGWPLGRMHGCSRWIVRFRQAAEQLHESSTCARAQGTTRSPLLRRFIPSTAHRLANDHGRGGCRWASQCHAQEASWSCASRQSCNAVQQTGGIYCNVFRICPWSRHTNHSPPTNRVAATLPDVWCCEGDAITQLLISSDRSPSIALSHTHPTTGHNTRQTVQDHRESSRCVH